MKAGSAIKDLMFEDNGDPLAESYAREDLVAVPGRLPPHSTECEQSALGAVLVNNEALHAVIEIIQPDDFYVGGHNVIFESMLTLFERNTPIDALTLTDCLREQENLERVGGVEYISHLVDIVPTSANAAYYARVIKEMSLRRRLIHEASAIVDEAFRGSGDIDAFVDSVEQRIFSVSDARSKAGFFAVREVVKDSIKEVERRVINKGAIVGLPSGFTDLDSLTAGLQPSDLIIIAARPAMGKTSLALTIARHVGVDLGRSVAVFSLEMSREQIVMRMLCSEARVDSSRARSGNLNETDFPRLVEAASRLSQSKIFIDDTPALSVLEMRAKARRLHQKESLSLVIVDYLQLMRGLSRRHERREQEISEISRSLKALAKELNVPVVALSQLNRSVESRQDRRPMMSDLRESGAIEQDADIISFVYRDEVYNQESADKGIAELIVSKHRNGPIGTVRLAFIGEFTSFENLAEEMEYDYLGSDVNFSAEEEDEI